ncbi:MAG: glutathione peroxidase [Burkholderiales bacterium]|jgi:glutathione peroxidase|nr:glutathione peroxidase [Burkholderiales bacterium]
MANWLRILTMTAVLAASSSQAAPCPPLLDRRMATLTEDAADLCRFRGHVLLVVNTASQCGFTPQYEGLEKLYQTYKDRGLIVLGFPANDFGRQEPGSNRDIAKFCEINYGVSFPMFAKTSVVGASVNPLHAALAKRAGRAPQWNFHKYLVDRAGVEVLSFDSQVAPDDPRLVAAIEKMLAAKGE